MCEVDEDTKLKLKQKKDSWPRSLCVCFFTLLRTCTFFKHWERHGRIQKGTDDDSFSAMFKARIQKSSFHGFSWQWNCDQIYSHQSCHSVLALGAKIISAGNHMQNGTTHLSWNLAGSWSRLYLHFRAIWQSHLFPVTWTHPASSHLGSALFSWLLREIDTTTCSSAFIACCSNLFISGKVGGFSFCVCDA